MRTCQEVCHLVVAGVEDKEADAAVAAAVAAVTPLHDLDADDGAGVALVLQVQRRHVAAADPRSTKFCGELVFN